MAAVVAEAVAGYAVVGVGVWAAGAALFVAAAFGSTWELALSGLIAAGGLVGLYVGAEGDLEWTAMAVSWAAYSFTVDHRSDRARVPRRRGARARAAPSSSARPRDARHRGGHAGARPVARELHDVVGHTLNVVVLQAGAAQRVFDKKPAVAREALASIEAAGRQALADIERLLGILRAEESESEDLGAQPGFSQIDRLIDQVREAGLPVELAIEGEAHELPQSIDLSAYRIIQEGLTNTLKHAGQGARAWVKVRYGADEFCLEIDDGGGAAGPRRPRRARAPAPAPAAAGWSACASASRSSAARSRSAPGPKAAFASAAAARGTAIRRTAAAASTHPPEVTIHER